MSTAEKRNICLVIFCQIGWQFWVVFKMLKLENWLFTIKIPLFKFPLNLFAFRHLSTPAHMTNRSVAICAINSVEMVNVSYPCDMEWIRTKVVMPSSTHFKPTCQLKVGWERSFEKGKISKKVAKYYSKLETFLFKSAWIQNICFQLTYIV